MSKQAGFTPGPWRWVTEQPPPGTKLVALYDDGSGAVLLYAAYDGFIEADGAQWGSDFLSDHFDRWQALPDDFQFNCERWREEAFTLPTPAHIAAMEAALSKATPTGSDGNG